MAVGDKHHMKRLLASIAVTGALVVAGLGFGGVPAASAAGQTTSPTKMKQPPPDSGGGGMTAMGDDWCSTC